MATRKSTPKPAAALLVNRHTGLTYVSAINRVSGQDQIPDIRTLLEDDARGMWGTDGAWTEHMVQRAMVRLVSEGFTPRKALEALQAQAGPMPSFHKVCSWLEHDKVFARDMVAAERCAAEMMADAAMETAMEPDSPLPSIVAGRKVRIQALQWRAAKLHRDKFGEMQKVEIEDNRPYAAVNVERLKAELAALMADPLVRQAVGPGVQDAEVVDVPALPDARPAEA
jgi:hypothetical protein